MGGIGDDRSRFGMQAPLLETFQSGAGMEQSLPADPPAALAYELKGSELRIASAHGDGALLAAKNSLQNIEIATVLGRSNTWWQRYVANSAKAFFPDPSIKRFGITASISKPA